MAIRFRWSCLLAAVVLLSAQGEAQVAPQKVAADAAFDEGKRLMAEGKHEAACARFAESQRLDPASSTLVWLGECLEKTGKLASAWSTFREAASMAARQGKADREKLARDRVAALEGRVPRVVLVVKTPPAGLVVAMDGVEIGSPLWGTPLPVDPGAHQLRLKAPGFQEKTVPFEVREASGTKDVPLPPLVRLAAPAASSAAAASSSAPPVETAAPTATPSATEATPSGLSGRQIGGLILGGAGLVLGGVGGLLQVDARSKADDARSRHDRALFDDASSQQTLAVSGMILGGALLTGGVVLFLLPPSPSSSASLRLAPQVSSRGSSLWLSGSFLPCVTSPCFLSLGSSLPPVASVNFPRTRSRPSPVAPVPLEAPAKAALVVQGRGEATCPEVPDKAAPGEASQGWGAPVRQGRTAEAPGTAAPEMADRLDPLDRGALEMAAQVQGVTVGQAGRPVRVVPPARVVTPGPLATAVPRAPAETLATVGSGARMQAPAAARLVGSRVYPEVLDRAAPGRAAQAAAARTKAARARAVQARVESAARGTAAARGAVAEG